MMEKKFNSKDVKVDGKKVIIESEELAKHLEDQGLTIKPEGQDMLADEVSVSTTTTWKN